MVFFLRSFSNTPSKPFNKILIANRGEIACRVIKTAKKMGIKTVAIFSDIDANSLHVKMADEAVYVGESPSNSSYLNIPNIMKAIKETNSEAVHPGYGFLSENFHFCEELEKNGVSFIGPGVEAISAMGDKIQSKLLAKNAGVNTIPGFNGVVKDVDHALEISNGIGYPVMIKASAGGGGKGMRIAWNDEEVRKNFQVAADESKSSFGDDRLLIEKYIDNPRHIEIQIIGDKHGKVIYLPERECSIQRRNQKVVEEAPSIFIDPETRKQMGQQAVQLAQKVNYSSAGTVEFLVDSQRNFYFLEMNTRLQVEHPITEMITGIDLVEQMIKVAADQKLDFDQSDVKLNGWAIESRVYAEDPTKYLPCIGRLTQYQEPGHSRCDSGIVEGSEISIFYDPMICKLATHAETRDHAISKMEQALDSYVIRGLTHNIPLLRAIVSHERFKSGNISTKFLEEEYPQGFQGHSLNEEEMHQLCCIISRIKLQQNQRDFHGTLKTNPLFYITLSGKVFETLVDGDFVVVNGKRIHANVDWKLEAPLIHATINEVPITAQYQKGDIIFKGTVVHCKVETEKEHQLSTHMKEAPKVDQTKIISSPMPGTVVNVFVKPGDIVREGGQLCVVEAMKMQNVLKAVHGGVVKEVKVSKGMNVAADDVLIMLE